jgi:DMSO/TMAO reductase YedYZ molybdopterin-dependent catalytic subunit
MGDEWEGVLARTVIDMAGPKDRAGYVLLAAHGGHTTNLDLGALMDAQTLLAFRFNGQDLEPEHGWPVRLLVPKKYGYKSLKWVRSIRVSEREELGYWEQRGWSNRADPWLEDR